MGREDEWRDLPPTNGNGRIEARNQSVALDSFEKPSNLRNSFAQGILMCTIYYISTIMFQYTCV